MPSRRTVACTATDWRNASTAFWARTSWTKSKMMLSMTMQKMMTKLATSPVAADTALAISKDDDQRVAEAGKELQPERRPLDVRRVVGSEGIQPGRRLGHGQSGGLRAQQAQ